MSLHPFNTTFDASEHSAHAAVTTLDSVSRDWRLTYQHAAEPCLTLKRRGGRVLRSWDRAQAVAIISHPRCQNLLCLPSLCHGHCISLHKRQAQTLLMIAACCSLGD
jgi:hypothetical protein